MSKIYGIPVGGGSGSGMHGSSAYELAVAEGFTGSLTEWLESLKGPQGEKGEPGTLTVDGDLDMANFRVCNMADPEASGDGVNLGYANANFRSAAWTPTAAQVGAVPTSRTVNGKALSSNISLSASDVGARPSDWMPSAADVGARPNNWIPTAGDVGAAAASHRHSAGDINSGTLPVSRGGTGVTTEAAIGLKAYPVNSIYMSVGSTSPASLFGGTWTRLKDRFLLGAGDTYANGKTGGAAAVTLTQNQIPSHSHLTMYQSPTAGAVGAIYDGIPMVLPGDVVSNTMMHYSGSTGGGGSHNNMPPYLVVYMWKRTA